MTHHTNTNKQKAKIDEIISEKNRLQVKEIIRERKTFYKIVKESIL
jgi:uncharacterized protein YerC